MRIMNLNLKIGPRTLILGLLFLQIAISGFQAKAADCALVADFLSVKKHLPSSSEPMTAWNTYQKQTWLETIKISDGIFSRYINGNWVESDSTKLAKCLSPSDIQSLQYEIHRSFWRKSIEIFKSKPGILATFGAHLESDQFQQYHVTGYLSEASPDDSKAGFHRGLRSVFMDFSRIPSNEWLVIFAHEMAHAMDKTLLEATDIYSDPQTAKVLAEWARKTNDRNQLPQDVQVKLSIWLKAGLDLVLWAEYRAWYVTVQIYREGLRNGQWQRIDWLESILKAKGPKETTAHLIYRYLDARYDNPTDGIFSLPLIKQSLENIRASYRNSGTLPPLGNLQEIISPISANK
jgi:hypothetical protein